MANKYEHLRPEPDPQPKLVNMHAGKRRYKSVSLALVAKNIMEMRTGDTFRAYHCPMCRQWHIGHPPQKPSSM